MPLPWWPPFRCERAEMLNEKKKKTNLFKTAARHLCKSEPKRKTCQKTWKRFSAFERTNERASEWTDERANERDSGKNEILSTNILWFFSDHFFFSFCLPSTCNNRNKLFIFICACDCVVVSFRLRQSQLIWTKIYYLRQHAECTRSSLIRLLRPTLWRASRAIRQILNALFIF